MEKCSAVYIYNNLPGLHLVLALFPGHWLPACHHSCDKQRTLLLLWQMSHDLQISDTLFSLFSRHSWLYRDLRHFLQENRTAHLVNHWSHKQRHTISELVLQSGSLAHLPSAFYKPLRGTLSVSRPSPGAHTESKQVLEKLVRLGFTLES